MNLRLCVQALLLIWLSLTSVCGGECLPPVRPRPSRRSLAAAATLSALRPTRALSTSRRLEPEGRSSHAPTAD